MTKGVACFRQRYTKSRQRYLHWSTEINILPNVEGEHCLGGSPGSRVTIPILKQLSWDISGETMKAIQSKSCCTRLIIDLAGCTVKGLGSLNGRPWKQITVVSTKCSSGSRDKTLLICLFNLPNSVWSIRCYREAEIPPLTWHKSAPIKILTIDVLIPVTLNMNTIMSHSYHGPLYQVW